MWGGVHGGVSAERPERTTWTLGLFQRTSVFFQTVVNAIDANSRPGALMQISRPVELGQRISVSLAASVLRLGIRLCKARGEEGRSRGVLGSGRSSNLGVNGFGVGWALRSHFVVILSCGSTNCELRFREPRLTSGCIRRSLDGDGIHSPPALPE